MKKYYLLWIIVISLSLMSWCTTVNTFEENWYINHEISTNLTELQIGEINSQDIIEKSFNKIRKNIQFDDKKIMKNREIMRSPRGNFYEKRKDLIPLQEFIIDIFWYKSYDYYIQRDIKDENLYHVYKWKKKLFSHFMTYGSESTIQEAVVIDYNLSGTNIIYQEAFTFYDYKILSWYRQPLHNRNIWYNWETINEKYHLSGSSHLFIYNNKIGLVWEKDSKKFILFDWVKISSEYDEISTHSCCAFHHYPLQLDKNWNFLFLAKKWTQYVFVEINLNKKQQ